MIEVKMALSENTESFHVYTAEAFFAGVKAVSQDGQDRIVDGAWMLEADTKVDDGAEFFPVIVHRWVV